MKAICLLIAALFFTRLQISAQTWDWTHPEPNGNLVSGDYDYAHDIQTDAAGNVYVLGNFNDSLYLNNIYKDSGQGSYLAKYDSTGKLLWYKLIEPTVYSGGGNAPYILATGLTVNANGIFITGKYTPGLDGIGDGCNVVNIRQNSYSIGNFNFTTGIEDNGFFLTKFNSNGNVVWNKTGTESHCLNGGPYFTTSILFLPVITSDKNNNIICSFIYNSNQPSFSIGSDIIPLSGTQQINPEHIMAVKYNANGVLQWSNYAIGDSVGVISDCNSIAADNNGNIFLYGTCSNNYQFGSQTFHTHFREGTGIIPYATFLAKISSAGVWQFAEELCNSSHNILDGTSNPGLLTIDKQNNIYALVNVNSAYPDPSTIMGDTLPDPTLPNSFSQYLVKINNNGNLTWHKGFANNAFAYSNANSISYSNNNLYITGRLGNNNYEKYTFGSLTVLPSSYYGAYFVAKANTNGDFQWVTSFSGTYNMEGYAVKAFNNNIYTSGYYMGSITTLGNLSGTYNGMNATNLFFGKLKDQYVRVGAVTPTQIIPGCTVTVPFTSTGLTFSAGNTFTAELSNANGDFTTPTAIGTSTSTGTGSITATIPASLTYGSGYRIRIHSSDTLKTGRGYYAYADTLYKLSLVCPAPSAGFAATNITGTAATVNWTAVGCAAGYKMQYRVKGTTTWTTKNISGNTATLNISGLTANTTYQWRVATRCVNNSTSSFSAFSANKQFITAAAFAAAVTAENISASAKDFSIYPNPATSTLNITAQMKLTGRTMISITDMAGKVVYQQSFQGSDKSFNHNINISKLSPGAYIFELITVNETQNGKFIKE